MASQDNRASSKPGNNIQSLHFLSVVLLSLLLQGSFIPDLPHGEIFDYMNLKVKSAAEYSPLNKRVYCKNYQDFQIREKLSMVLPTAPM